MIERAILKKWACRLFLLAIVTVFTYVATRESYNFAHWVPHAFLKHIGIPYSTLLWAEQNADIALHFLGALFITLLLRSSQLSFISNPKWMPVLIVVILCFGAEFAQHLIGRGIETSDLLLGICGSFVAYLASD